MLGVLCALAAFLHSLEPTGCIGFAGARIQILFFSGDFSGMPYFVIPALLAVIVGLLLIGIFILHSGLIR